MDILTRLKRGALMVLLAIGIITLATDMAYASAAPVAASTSGGSGFTLSAGLVMMISTFVIPIIVGLLTKYNASASLKQFVTAILAAVASLINAATQLDGTAVISKEMLTLAIGTFVLSQATYLGIYKPLDLNAKTAPNLGVGKNTIT